MVDLHPEHARAVLDDLPIGVVLIDRDGRVSWINRYATNFLGGDADQVLGHEIAALPLPFRAAGRSKVDDEPQVQVDGAMIGITQRYEHAAGEGSILIILDRGHALVWFLNALSYRCIGHGHRLRGAVAWCDHQPTRSRSASRSRRYANPLSCITVQLGKEAERALVGEIARNVKGQLRWVDLLGQWNDETLLLVLPETDEFAARALSEKLLSSVSLIICSSRVSGTGRSRHQFMGTRRQRRAAGAPGSGPRPERAACGGRHTGRLRACFVSSVRSRFARKRVILPAWLHLRRASRARAHGRIDARLSQSQQRVSHIPPR